MLIFQKHAYVLFSMKINIRYNLIYSIFFSFHYINKMLGFLKIM